jgi:hypothetical protein
LADRSALNTSAKYQRVPMAVGTRTGNGKAFKRTLPLRHLLLAPNEENSRKRCLIACRGTRLRDHPYHERRAKSRRGGRLCHGVTAKIEIPGLEGASANQMTSDVELGVRAKLR